MSIKAQVQVPLTSKLPRFFGKERGSSLISGFELFIEYPLSLQRMLDMGDYDEVDGRITPQLFKLKKGERVERTAQLVRSPGKMKYHRAAEWLDRLGLRAGKIEELLAFGAAFPSFQLRSPVVAVGSVRYIPTLHRPKWVPSLTALEKDKRRVILCCLDAHDRNAYFLAFPKEPEE